MGAERGREVSPVLQDGGGGGGRAWPPGPPGRVPGFGCGKRAL